MRTRTAIGGFLPVMPRARVDATSTAGTRTTSPSRRGIGTPSGVAAIRALFSFEALFAAFLLSLVYAQDPRLSWLPLNPVLITFGASAIAGMIVLLVREWPERGRWEAPTLAWFVFLAYAALALTWSRTPEYGAEKLFRLVTFTSWSLLGSLLIVSARPERMERFLFVLLLGAILITMDGWRAWAVTPPGHSLNLSYLSADNPEAGGAHYQRLGRSIGLGAVVALVAWMHRPRPQWLVVCAFLVGLIMVGGGRGPMLALLAAILVAGLLSISPDVPVARYARSPFRAWLLLFVVTLGGAVIIVTGYESATLQRLDILLDRGPGKRSELWLDAWSMWLQAPLLGNGLGSFASPGSMGWPHNIVLEILAELGMVGLGLSVAVVATACRGLRLAALRQDPLALCAFLLLVFGGVNASASGDLGGNSYLFLALGLCGIVRCSARRRDDRYRSSQQRPDDGFTLRSASARTGQVDTTRRV